MDKWTSTDLENNKIPILNSKQEEIEKLNPNTINTNNTNKKERTGWQRYIGILLALASCLSFTLCILIVKYLNKNISPSSFGLYRFFGLVLSIPILIYYKYIKKTNLFSTVWPLTHQYTQNRKTVLALLFRGIGGCTAILLQYYSISYISIASATVICFSTPIFVGFFAWLFLGEKCGVVPVITAFVTFFGVVLTAKIIPGAGGNENGFEINDNNLIGGALAFVSMLCATAVFIILRYLRHVHFSLVTTVFGFIGIVQSGIICAIIGKFDLPQTLWEIFLVVSIALLTLLGQICITAAMKFENAGPIALVRTADVVFAFIWQSIFLGEIPDIYTAVGGFIVILGVVFTAFRKYISTLPPHHKNRERYSFILK